MAEIKYYTLAEVATHKTNNDVWMVIHNNVYNVTDFLNEVSYRVLFRGDNKSQPDD